MNCIDIETPLGTMLIADHGDGLAGLWFSGQRHFPADASNWPRHRTSLLTDAESQVQAYMDGQRQTFDLPLAAQGTTFQQSVWQYLQTIPYGERHSYGQIARSLKKPASARAVGRAVGTNPWSLVIPCHRVVGSNGALTGYAGGLERKRWLLAMEAESGQKALVQDSLGTSG